MSPSAETVESFHRFGDLLLGQALMLSVGVMALFSIADRLTDDNPGRSGN